MKKEIKNVSEDSIKLFVMREEIEEQVDIPPGQSVVVDDYETKTIRIFKRKGLITIESYTDSLENQNCNILKGKSEIELQEDEKRAINDSIKRTMSNVDPNTDEVMDHFHKTEYHESKLVMTMEEEDLRYFKENLIKGLTEQENSTRLEVIEGEVEQYIEKGFIKGAWTDEDIAYLKKNYPTKGRKRCSTHLNRVESSVQKKINSLGLKKKKKKK
jgi:hypothetical protein